MICKSDISIIFVLAARILGNYNEKMEHLKVGPRLSNLWKYVTLTKKLETVYIQPLMYDLL